MSGEEPLTQLIELSAMPIPIRADCFRAVPRWLDEKERRLIEPMLLGEAVQ
jgi:hypothetical protein